MSTRFTAMRPEGNPVTLEPIDAYAEGVYRAPDEGGRIYLLDPDPHTLSHEDRFPQWLHDLVRETYGWSVNPRELHFHPLHLDPETRTYEEHRRVGLLAYEYDIDGNDEGTFPTVEAMMEHIFTTLVPNDHFVFFRFDEPQTPWPLTSWDASQWGKYGIRGVFEGSPEEGVPGRIEPMRNIDWRRTLHLHAPTPQAP